MSKLHPTISKGARVVVYKHARELEEPVGEAVVVAVEAPLGGLTDVKGNALVMCKVRFPGSGISTFTRLVSELA